MCGHVGLPADGARTPPAVHELEKFVFIVSGRVKAAVHWVRVNAFSAQ